VSRLHDFYTEQVRDSLREKFGYKNGMEIPKLEKIVINIGVGEATENSKAVDAAANDLAAITGQRPMICKAHKSLAAWKIREGMPLGCKVTLRGEKMYEFLDRLINLALLFRAYVTSAASATPASTDAETMLSALKNS
jgi:large subunit ribosomal protein L5